MGLTAGRWIGPLCAVLGVLGFSFKAILIKLAYAWHPVDAVTLLTLRMLFAAPFFVAMAWWAGRRPGAQPIGRRAIAALVLSYGGIAVVFAQDVGLASDARAVWTGGGLVFASAFLYALYLVGAGDVIARIGSVRFIAWAMLASATFVFLQFALTRDVALLRVPPPIYGISLAMAVFSTVLPTCLVAEAIRRIGANASSLVGSLGPVFTIGLGAAILGEPVHSLQLAGAALVLVGVMLVTLKPRATVPAEEAPPPALT